MKHYLQVSGLSRSITTLSYKWFPNHRGNRYPGTLKDKWERRHMQGQSQTSQTPWLSLLPQKKICRSQWAPLSERYHSHFRVCLVYIPIYTDVCLQTQDVWKRKLTHTWNTVTFLVLEKTNKQQLPILAIVWMGLILFRAIEQISAGYELRG